MAEKEFIKIEEIKVPFAPSSHGFMCNMRRINSFVKHRYGPNWEIKKLQRNKRNGQWKMVIGEKPKVKEQLHQLFHSRN